MIFNRREEMVQANVKLFQITYKIDYYTDADDRRVLAERTDGFAWDCRDYNGICRLPFDWDRSRKHGKPQIYKSEE